MFAMWQQNSLNGNANTVELLPSVISELDAE
jgi:hypothetical protein